MQAIEDDLSSTAPSISAESGVSGTSKSSLSQASSGLSSTSGLGITAQFKARIFELVYLSSSSISGSFFTCLLLLLISLETIQLLAIPLQPETAVFPYGFDTARRYFSYVYISPMIMALSANAVAVVAALLLLVFVAFVLGCFLIIRAIQTSQAPNALIVRFITFMVVLLLAGGFVPILSAFVLVTKEYLSSASVGGYFAAAAAAVMALTTVVCATTVALLVFPSVMNSSNPLGRMHGRVDAVYVLSKTALVLLSLIGGSDVIKYCTLAAMAVCTLLAALPYAMFIPYYSMIANIARTFTASLTLLPIAAAVHPIAIAPAVVVVALLTALPLASYYVTELPSRRYRARLAIQYSTHADARALLARYSRLPFLLPFQAEIALRHPIRRTRHLQDKIDSIERRLPLTVMEYEGAVSDGGTIDYDVLPQEWKDQLAEAKEQLAAEVDSAVRMFMFVRSQWKQSPFACMAFVHLIACFKGNNLHSVVNSTSDVFTAGRTPGVLLPDVQYFAFITQKYSSALQGDSSVMERLEAQRNMTTLLRSQRGLTDALAAFWIQVAAQRAHRISLRRLNGFVSSVQKIQGMMAATEKLYARMLRDPTPRLLRSYIQYVGLVNRHEVVREYINALEGQADELEVVRGNEHGDIRRRRKTPKIAMFDLARRSTSFISLHIRALVSVMLIAALFGSSILMVAIALQMCRFISWQLIISSGVATGIQLLGLGYSTLRSAGSPMTLAAAVQTAGPIWKTMTMELPEDYILTGLGTYKTLLDVYFHESWDDVQDNPYEPFDGVSLALTTEAVNQMVSLATRYVYNLESLLADTEITVTNFVNSIPDSNSTDSLYSFVSRAIYAAESLVYCIKTQLDAGAADPVSDCTADHTDELLGFEHTLATSVIYGLFEVADAVYQKSQLFPVLETAIFTVVFVLFLSLFLFVSVGLYIVPLAKDVSFNAHLVGLFTRLSLTTVDRFILKYEKSHNKRVSIKMRIADREKIAQTHPYATHPLSPITPTRLGASYAMGPDSDDSDDVVDAKSVSRALRVTGPSLGDRPDPVPSFLGDDGEPEAEIVAEVESFDLADGDAELRGNTTLTESTEDSGYSDYDSASDQCHFHPPRGRSPVPGMGASSSGAKLSAEHIQRLQISFSSDSGRKHSGSSLLLQAPSTPTKADSQNPSLTQAAEATRRDSASSLLTPIKQLATVASMVAGADGNPPTSAVAVRINSGSIRVAYALRQVPMLAVWLVSFGVIFIAMTGYALYQTGDITQTASSIFVQYRSLLLLAHLNQACAASTWDDTTAPTSLDAAVGLFDADMVYLTDLIPYLTGLDSDLEIIDSAWDNQDSLTRTLATRLLAVLAQDHWTSGYHQTDIDNVLHSKQCLRIRPDACVDSRTPEARQGLLALAETYMSYAMIAEDEMRAGMIMGSGQTFLNTTAVLDMSGGMFLNQGFLRNRFTTLISTTQTNIMLFFVFFVCLLAVFYFLYFFRAIVRMSRTRRCFDLIFQSVPREQVEPKLVADFLEYFPDDDEMA
ncbi:tmcB-like protein [Carpediemonas membranifera]|uniref:TmcB-like protein n=1 Tax=Carpediemonas membranifera TaxID=201153 RepID=A0A8J6E8A2_9EUKA|nr:tmcB-like protein [Carpediemonas membranifera]|eukprot:KAG9391615.1 tmcB-like protein [Carpediemonas membranifera]